MLDSPLNANAVPCRGNGMIKSWDRSAARARGSALSRDYRTTASALGLPDPSKVVGTYSASTGGGMIFPENGKQTSTPLTSVTKSDYRAPTYSGYRGGYNGGFQPSVLNSYSRNDQTKWNGEDCTPPSAKSMSSFPRELPPGHNGSPKVPEQYSARMATKDLDFANPIEPQQFSWPTPKSVPVDYDAMLSSTERAPLSKEEFIRNLKAEQARRVPIANQDYGLPKKPDSLLDRSTNAQFTSVRDDLTNYQGSRVSSRPFNLDPTVLKGNYQEKQNEYLAQPSFQPYDAKLESELPKYAKELDRREKKENSIAEKPYESHQPPIDSIAPGYTKAAVKSAVANAVNPTANYSVGPGYTDNQYAAGIVRPRYGAPSRNWPGLPASDPSYPLPEYKIPQPEAGLKKLTWKDEKDQTEITRLAPEFQARYPGDAYKISDDNFGIPQSAYVPSTFEQQRYTENKVDYQPKNDNDSQFRGPPSGKIQTSEEQIPDVEYNPSVPEDSGTKNMDVTSESNALKGLKKIQTTNQTYGSWVDDPYLQGREWWYKPIRFPLNKTFLSKFKEDAGIWS